MRESAPGQQSPVRAEAPGGAHLSPFVKGARGARPGELTARREEAGTAGRAARAPPPAPRLFGSGRGGRGAGPLDPLAPGLLSARRFAPSHPVGRSPVSDSREAGAARTRAAQVGSGHLACPGWDAAEDRGGTSGGGHRTSGSCGRPLGVRKPGGHPPQGGREGLQQFTLAQPSPSRCLGSFNPGGRQYLRAGARRGVREERAAYCLGLSGPCKRR